MITTLYSVFVISCSVAQPFNCDKEYLGDIHMSTPIGCLAGAQPNLRKWIEEHAGIRTFKRLKCVDSRRKARELGRDMA